MQPFCFLPSPQLNRALHQSMRHSWGTLFRRFRGGRARVRWPLEPAFLCALGLTGADVDCAPGIPSLFSNFRDVSPRGSANPLYIVPGGQAIERYKLEVALLAEG
ncbi:hypothetical protein FA13DRAFT_1726396 [Coprinellus micaceus]|uniref:Uncharacterized protein n=1 Tax=Coprinellus micaceus TaxID=71717 RepID=A0A4Y7TT08_COPMI|nr:hypothetical protein FA13DRAFT_1726396 [Coprinellus micaceus]